LFKRGDYGNALPPLQAAAAGLDRNPVVQFHVGMDQYMLGDEGSARRALQKAVDAGTEFPEKDEARQRLALLAIDPTKANSSARAELEKFLGDKPNDPAATMRLAQIQVRDGVVDQAIKTFEKLVADAPSYAPATRELALLYSQRQTNDAKAYELAQKARQLYPDDAEVAKGLGILTYRRELYPQAIELLKEAGAKRKDDPEIPYYLGQAHHEAKQWNECKVALERALNLRLPPDLANQAGQALADCSEALPQ
jgi:tetratricopeptide (TPR) repeat protein